MKVALVGYMHGSGGAERQIITIANALAERGHEIYLIILAEYNKKYDITEKVIVRDLSIIEKQYGNKIFLRFRALKKVYIDIKPDVTIHFWLQSAYLTAFMPKSICGKTIYSERGDPGDAEYNGLLIKIRNWAFKHIEGFVFQSEGARDYFNDDIKKQSVVIHNSVSIPDEKFIEPCKERNKKIVNVGRLHPQKNQKLLIDAFSKIAQEFPEYCLEIYGDGELESQLNEQIKFLGLVDRVKLLPSRKDIFDCIYTATLFILSSDYEGMPNALMEAMALGVPCVSTDYNPGGASTLIENEINGCIVPPGSADLLASKISDLLKNQKLSNQLAFNAIEIRKTHSPNIIFDLWEGYIKKLVELE